MSVGWFSGSAVGDGRETQTRNRSWWLWQRKRLDLATWAEQTNVGDMTIDALADGASRLARDYLQKPPLPVLREAASAYRRVSGLLRGGHQSLRQTRDLYVIAGQLLAFLSWVSSDIGQSSGRGSARPGRLDHG